MANGIGFVSDSTIDLPKETLLAHGIETVPLHVTMDGVEYKDGVDIRTDDLYAYAHRTKTLPKTSAVQVDDFVRVFSQVLDRGDDVIYAGLSSELSSTYQAANIAKDQLSAGGYDPARIHLIDSLQLSTGIALLLLHGVDLYKAGRPAREIAKDMARYRGRICTSFIVDTLLYLHMGGRCTAIQYIASNVLRLHPQIDVTGGKLVPGNRYRGNINYCIMQYCEKIVQRNLASIDPARIFITHTSEKEQVRIARDLLGKMHHFREIIDTQAGATIASHCGPGTLGFLFIMKEPP